MSDAKHTPGPWQARGRFVAARGCTDTYNGTVWGAIADAVDLTQVDDERRTWTCAGDKEANACLIAAAPELLFALQNLLAVKNGEGGTVFNSDEIARAAIAKALGK